MKRFGTFIENDCFKLATYLDPVFGPKAFTADIREKVKQRLKYHIGLVNPNLLSNVKVVEANKTVSSNYTFYEEASTQIENLDDMDLIIDKYVKIVSSANYTDTLAFWKAHESTLPILALLAKKFLAVPASSASVERMFNISGHVFSNKRRRTGIKLFEPLVFLKLNEHYL